MFTRFLEFFKLTFWRPKLKAKELPASNVESAVIYEEIRGNRWVLEIDNFDSFLVRDVQLPGLGNVLCDHVSCHSWCEKIRKMTVVFYETTEKSTLKRVYDLLDKDEEQQLNATFKFLDSVGNVVETIKMTVVISSAVPSYLSYFSMDLMTTTVEFRVCELKIT